MRDGYDFSYFRHDKEKRRSRNRHAFSSRILLSRILFKIYEKNWDKVFPPTRVGFSSSASPKYGAIHQVERDESEETQRQAA